MCELSAQLSHRAGETHPAGGRTPRSGGLCAERGRSRAGLGPSDLGPVSAHPYGPRAQHIIDQHRDGWVLDLGSGGKLSGLAHVVQMDIFPYPCVDVVASAHALPFKAAVFDAVISQAVFEHLRWPERAVAEIRRVAKAGAQIKIDTAFLQPEHAYPDHYFNATQAGGIFELESGCIFSIVCCAFATMSN